MSSFTSRQPSVLAAAVGVVLALGLGLPEASAEPQARSASRQARKADTAAQAPKAAAQFPNATREEPDARPTARGNRKLSEMMGFYDGKKGAEARAVADEILADDKANAYEKSFAAQVAAQLAYDADDTDGAIAMYQRVIELNGLDNNSHYGAMLNLAQMLQMQERYPESLAAFDRYFAETGSSNPEDLMMKGQSFYLMENHAEAAKVMRQAIDASPEPKPEWQALLMQVYAETGNNAEAVRMAEQVAAAKPDDKRALLNLAVVYDQADMQQKAVEVLEKLRAAGQLTTRNEYNQLYVTYLNMEGHERQAAEVIQDGLAKGAMQPDYNSYIALAQAYYFSDQPALAIEAYQKAAPLDDDGETYLNLAKVLFQEDRIAEAKAAAKQAMDKGVKRPEDARSILSAGN